jgi:hypothetical protein
MLPLGLRNNNPGNIRPSTPPWQGAIGVNGGFVVFDRMENGIRALARQLIAYYEHYSINTVHDAISRWAPGNENNTQGYIDFVCSVLECGENDVFDFHDPSFLFWMVTAIGEEENGADSFTHNVTDEQINTGVSMALQQPK